MADNKVTILFSFLSFSPGLFWFFLASRDNGCERKLDISDIDDATIISTNSIYKHAMNCFGKKE